MLKLSETELLARDAKRDLNAELLESIEHLKAGQLGRVSVVARDGRIVESTVARMRLASRLSPSQFSELLGVTLQACEQGEGEPVGAAKTLIRMAERHPDLLRELTE
jgi:putative transcriptional regulator